MRHGINMIENPYFNPDESSSFIWEGSGGVINYDSEELEKTVNYCKINRDQSISQSLVKSFGAGEPLWVSIITFKVRGNASGFLTIESKPNGERFMLLLNGSLSDDWTEHYLRVAYDIPSYGFGADLTISIDDAVGNDGFFDITDIYVGEMFFGNYSNDNIRNSDFTDTVNILWENVTLDSPATISNENKVIENNFVNISHELSSAGLARISQELPYFSIGFYELKIRVKGDAEGLVGLAQNSGAEEFISFPVNTNKSNEWQEETFDFINVKDTYEDISFVIDCMSSSGTLKVDFVSLEFLGS